MNVAVKASHNNFSDASSIGERKLQSLPAQAQEKFRKLARAETRARALISGLRDEAERTRESLAATQRDLAIFDRRWPPQFDVQDGVKVRVEYPERQQLVGRIEALKADIARLNAEMREANLGYNTAELLDWLARTSGNFKMAAPVKPPSLTGEALAKIRADQNGVRDELTELENAKLTTKEAKAAMRAQVAALAAEKRPDVASLFLGGGIEWPTELFVANNSGAVTVATTVKDAFSLALWANAETIIAKLDAEIEAMGDDENAISAQDRKARIADANKRLTNLMRIEETIITALENSGTTVQRVNTDPLILLGIE